MDEATATQNKTNRTEWYQKPKCTIGANNNEWPMPHCHQRKAMKHSLSLVEHDTLQAGHAHTLPSPLSTVPCPMFKVHARNSIRFKYSIPKMCDQHEMQNENEKHIEYILVDRIISGRFDDGVTVYLHHRK